jgi:hypothetical protein
MKFRLFFLKTLLVGSIVIFCFNNQLLAQTPDPNDPGIGGPGSSSVGAPSSDGVPVVPFDGGMSLILLASGLSFASNKLRKTKHI